jgi:predicted nucleotidyltransferase
MEAAVATLLAAAPAGSSVVVFGSRARGDARPDSDYDLLVVEPTLADRHAEMVRLRNALRPLRIPADVLVVSRGVFEKWKDVPASPLYEANREGVVHDKAA